MEKFKRVSTYMIFVFPALAIYLAVIAFPIISSVGLSFTDYNIYKNLAIWTGLANYIKIFKDPVFWFSMRNNFFVIFVSVFGQIPLGFVLAYLIYRRLVKRSVFFQAMVFLPTVISTIIIGILWSKMFSPIGVVPRIIQVITNNPDYSMTIMTNKNLAMIPIGFVLLWMYTGTYLIIFLANLQNIDPDIIEAAQIDGATDGQIFRKIIVPQLYGVLVLTSILAISGSLRSFDLIFAMTGGGPAYYTNLLSIYMYNQSFIFHNYGVGSAVSTVMVILSIVLVILIRLARRKIDIMEA
ncbi:MAG: sugar ABC transporter permease [Actinobacteria bacterium RBG_13_35_12]|uniref:Sugar ABC transporter permease n=1 Tax=Candidatus Sediminicultor quintus TaxID=1797291 RepID=A0A1F5AGJ9_9BACT|nr:MAG: sugar ABC transporter permease [Actinobacteria bacterium RBG_13_35_12]OGD17580.1 MAG: sugar ABC transporter permease [Candidatus Atribacteria bacterium RBG_19FT_COMBO_35_14]